MNKTNLEKRIYNAQCYGNIEPIEYMVPYPNLHALVEGQNVKYKDHLLYHDLSMTNEGFFIRVQKAAHWLKASGVHPKDRVMMAGLPFPTAEIIAFGIWTMGAILVLTAQNDLKTAKTACQPIFTVPPELDLEKEINVFDEQFIPAFKPNLQEEAVIYWRDEKAIRLSHYNLLINANGIQKKLDLFEKDSFYIKLKSDSTAWIVLQAILPLYTGAGITSKGPKIKIGLQDQFKSSDYIIDFNWTELKNTTPLHLYIKPENTAVLAIGSSPVHMTAIEKDNQHLKISGHSVMMGYLNNKKNQKIFIKGKMNI